MKKQQPERFAKAILLRCERQPITTQKASFHNAKGCLLENRSATKPELGHSSINLPSFVSAFHTE